MNISSVAQRMHTILAIPTHMGEGIGDTNTHSYRVLYFLVTNAIL